MAINKQALIRYKILDKCFRNQHKRFFMEDLIEACNQALSDHYGEGKTISRRQIYDDLNFMESEVGYGAAIDRIKHGRKTYYRYEDLDFSIEKTPLTKEELEALENMSQILGRVNGISGFEWFNKYQTKLEDITSGPQNTIISFDENEYLQGLEYLQDLYNYIKNHSSIRIKYQAFNIEEELDIVFHPYFLKEYNNRWFLFGLNDKYSLLQNLAIDRIKDIELSDVEYIPNENYDFIEYFEDIVGVTF